MKRPVEVLVVGAGASGMTAAGRAAQSGASVTVLEKTRSPGNKLLLTGNGRCNLTNAKDLHDFVLMYGRNGRFLYPAFKQFFREDLVAFLQRRGVATMSQTDGRVFTSSGHASDVVASFEKYMVQGGVLLEPNTGVDEIVVDHAKVQGIYAGGGFRPTKTVVLATGGASYPRTGSAGDGYRMAASVGHKVVRLRPSLVPLVVEELQLASGLQGLGLHGIRLTAYRCDSRKVTAAMAPSSEYGRGIEGGKPSKVVIESRQGDLMFTHFGLGGPVTLSMSLAVVDALAEGPVSVSIDLTPGENVVELNARLQNAFDASGKKELENALAQLMPGRLSGVVSAVAGVPGTKLCSQVTARERGRLAESIKALRFNVKGPRPLSEAMVTAGGVSLDEIDSQTMASKLVSGLYFCGEVIDVDAETGGFNLQAAFSTGYLAGQSAAAYVCAAV